MPKFPDTRHINGAKTMLTPFVYKSIIAIIEKGNWTETAAVAAGVGLRNVTRWIQIGSGEHPTLKAKEPFISFARDVETASAKAEARLVNDLGVQEDWRAKAWLLERGPARDRWSQNVTISAQLAPAASILDTLRSRAAAIEEGDEIEPLQIAEPVETEAKVKEPSDAKSG